MSDIKRTPLTANEIADRFSDKFAGKISDISIRQWTEGAKSTPVNSVWITIERSILHDAVKEVISIDYPHFGVISAVDEVDFVELLYHMYVYFGCPGKGVEITLKVALPKEDLIIPTISDLIPGAVYSEREKRELMGVEVADIPDKRGLFLPDDFPKGIYPWRKDDAGIKEGMVKDLWAVGRPEDRPNPPVKPKPKKEAKSGGDETKNSAPKNDVWPPEKSDEENKAEIKPCELAEVKGE
ncbi:NADH-quinone oxidoreductase subunit C [Methanoplanus sp. FWC-SCC4]|uniref:NADH-quinone oxidoreductase subunit C n=1 Tax=Methanochimaera problematica TaxID=2609417 RepID=A0AA97FCI3_9EURY|nr:NADH-quinone oxidoreductase subunit C [Methanoplanus sp. FWC-SCC4]WOF16362.1 NADH-quinone oxidoreductase subunit C [Methanoplanus sp. FWC-SCC4]